MKNNINNHTEIWLWIELIGFDNTVKDFGVNKFLNKTSFIPEAVILLVYSPDFIHLHDNLNKERKLLPEVCAYAARPRSEERMRQNWTNYQLLGLINELHQYNILVFCSFFNLFKPLIIINDNNKRWAINHPELYEVDRKGNKYSAINPLHTMNNDKLYQDFFKRKLLTVLKDYNFDGYHGADGYSSTRNPLSEVDFSDDMVNQFVQAMDIELPQPISLICEYESKKIETRANWILDNKKELWLKFYSDRWFEFWSDITELLHQAKKKVVLNTAWTRAPFEAYYRYGIDYTELAETGIDTFIVETVAPVMETGGYDRKVNSHYDFMSMLMLIKCSTSGVSLKCLQTVHDDCEGWDILHHAPTVLERDIYSFSNLYNYDKSGELKRCSSGPVICLSDSINNSEWQWLQEKINLGFSFSPKNISGATMIWSHTQIKKGVTDYLKTGRWSPHKILYELMVRGAAIYKSANIDFVNQVKGPILIPASHLLSEDELESVFSYDRGTIIFIGAKMCLTQRPDYTFRDIYNPESLFCLIYNTSYSLEDIDYSDIREKQVPYFSSREEPSTWLEELPYCRVSDGFLQNCVQVINRCSGIQKICDNKNIQVQCLQAERDKLIVFIGNDSNQYCNVEIKLRHKIKDIQVLTPFPVMPVNFDNKQFKIKVPGKGMVVLKTKIFI